MIGKLGLSVAETAELLGLSRSAVYQLARVKDFPVVKFGSRIFINAARLQEWMDKHTKGMT